MLDHALTRQERNLVFVLRWWIVLFAGAGIAFAIFPNEITGLLGTLGRIIFGWRGPLIKPSTDKFWLVLSISLMVVLTLSAIKAQINLLKNISYVKIILISKLASTIGYLFVLIFVEHAFAYLVGAAVDGSILVITWLFYRKAVLSRYGK